MGWMLSKILRCMSDTEHPPGKVVAYWCPGCDCAHAVPLEKKNENGAGPWSFNGDVNAPSFSPSLDVHRDSPVSRCHSIVSNGKITFCSDCGKNHPLKGQTVSMVDWPGILD